MMSDFGRNRKNIQEVVGMDILRKLWPTPFSVKEKDIVSLIVKIIIFLVICAVVGVLIGILAKIPLIGVIFGIIGGLMELYSTIGIVLCILKFLGLIK